MSAASAATYNWNVASGDFNTAGNWNPSGLPGSADTADVNNGGIATISSIDPTISVSQLLAGDSSGSGTVNQTGDTVNVSGALQIGNASAGLYTLSGSGAINTSSGGIIRVYGNSTPGSALLQVNGGTISNPNEFDVGYYNGTTAGNGALNISSGSSINVGGNLEIGEGSGATGVVTMNGGSLAVTGQLWIGDAGGASNDTGGNGTFILNGGTVTTSNWAPIARGGSTTGVLTINGGTFIHLPSGSNAFELGSYGDNNHTANTSTLNLNAGGTLITDYIEDESPGSTAANPGTQTINFNGGLLEANASDGGYIGGHGGTVPTLNVMAGGLIFNPGGFGDAITVPLLQGPGTTVDGGVSVVGAGTLFLNAANTFNGNVNISTGTIQVASDAGLGATPRVYLTNSGALQNNVNNFAVTQPIVISGTGYLDPGWGGFSVSGNITGGNLGITFDSGTLVLSGSDSYTGSTLLGGYGSGGQSGSSYYNSGGGDSRTETRQQHSASGWNQFDYW